MNMFDLQRQIFTTTANAILTQYSTCRIVNAFIYAPEVFPCVSIVLSDDGTNSRMRDSSKADNFRDITLTVDVYSNKQDGKKTEAEAIMQIIIDTLFPLNFNMVSCKPFSNINNASNYRITATFTATVDSNGTIYTRM